MSATDEDLVFASDSDTELPATRAQLRRRSYDSLGRTYRHAAFATCVRHDKRERVSASPIKER